MRLTVAACHANTDLVGDAQMSAVGRRLRYWRFVER
jgi:hypothetical protein